MENFFTIYWLVLVVFLTGAESSSNGFPWFSGRYNVFCHWKECCNKLWIPRDVEALYANLQSDVFGQHLVIPVVYGSLKGYLQHLPKKPMVLSFHGTTGTGKTHVARIIAQHWYKEGMNSKYVHFKSATRHYGDKGEIERYKRELQQLVFSAVKKCPFQMFIFDEIDSLPPGLLDSLRSFLDYNEHVDGVDFRKSIFIFLSNSGEKGIVHRTTEHYTLGYPRQSITLKEMEEEIVKWIFSEGDSGLHKSRLISHHLVSHFIPFMPLERGHVIKCINREISKKGYDLSHFVYTKQFIIEKVVSEISFRGIDSTSGVYAVKGCKNVEEKLNYILVTMPNRNHIQDEL